MLKKILVATSLFLSVNSAFALDFLGVTLEDLNRKEMTEVLKKNGAKLKNKESLIDIFSLKTSKIPYAEWAVAYYNKKNEFVGLKIGFDYDDHNLINLRKTLVEKYGRQYKVKDFFKESPGHDELEKKLFNDIAIWKFPNNTSIEYNADGHEQYDNPRDLESYAFLFFRHDARKEELLEQLSEDSKKNDDKKFKGIF